MSYEQIFWAMFGVSTISILYPWDPKWPFAKRLIHLPWLLLPLWGAYELALPDSMNIRLDLPFIWMGLAAIFMIYAVRLVLFYFWLPKSNR